MTDTIVSIASGDAVLEGTYRQPTGDGPHPAALLIAGSGPLDRNGNLKRLGLNVSGLLAPVLAKHGWSTLRFDKRGVGASSGDYLRTGFYDELDDATAALRWLESREDVTHVVPIGHSVGALFAAEMASRGSARSGVVLLAYTAMTGEQTLVWQASQLAETLPGWLQASFRLFGTSLERQQRKALDKLTASTDDVIRLQGQKVSARWMREFIAYDPRPALEMIGVPFLAITGSKDAQVNPEDLDTVAAIAPTLASTLVAADVDHILRHEVSPRSNPKRYKQQSRRPLASVVTDTLVEWLEARTHVSEETAGAG